jgi:hypothetical protein
MKIRVHKSNRAKIEARLEIVNGRALDHTYSHYDDIATLASDAEARRITLRLSRTDARGMRVRCTSGDTVARAYKWSRKATRVELTYCATGWFITDLKNTTIYTDGGSVHTILSPALDRIAIQKFKDDNYTVQPIAIAVHGPS